MALLATIVLPLAAAGVIAFIPRDRGREIKVLSLLVSAAALVLSVVLFAMYDYKDGGYQFSESFKWLDAPLNISLSLGLDGISAPMVLLTGIVMFAGVLVSWNIEHRPKDFFVLYMALVAGVFGTFVTRDLFFLFFFYELAVLPMYLLIGVWGSSSDFGTFLRTKDYSAMKLVLYLVAGSVLVWVSILAVYWMAYDAGMPTFSLGDPDSGVRTLQDVNFNDGFKHFETLFFPLFMIGFGVLAGLWPFHTWSPDGHVAAPTAVSMLHAGVLMKLGAYGIIRVGMFLFPDGAEQWMPLLIGLGTVNVIYGAISAMAQQDLKYVVGYSSVSHMGYVLMGIATLHPLGVGGAVLQMFSHGIMTALFFAMVGVIYDRAHIRDINVLGGLSKRMGKTAVPFRSRRSGLPWPARSKRFRCGIPGFCRRVSGIPAPCGVGRGWSGHNRRVHIAAVGQGFLWAAGPPLGASGRRNPHGVGRRGDAGLRPDIRGRVACAAHERD